ncbi:MAG: ABC transporter ATP-binding protein [Cytophaga sp.]|nr:ABC transporter ATP-binding protein [Undibacterium sp.]
MDDVAIKIDHVSKTFKLPHEKQSSIKSKLINFRKGSGGYEQQKALDDVSFEIKKGDFFAIIGRNGSGKSTLLKLLAGIYVPTKGSIEVVGKLTPFIELGVGFNPELTGRENVFLNGALLGFNRSEMSEMYQDIVDFAEIERFMDQKLKNYSSGMQVRLAFSIAIRAQTDILLLDEVLAVGDAAFQDKCYNYFEELKAQHKTVIFVSHSMDAVRRFCTNAVYIDSGHLTHVGTPAEIADVYLEENMERSVQSAAKQAGPVLSQFHKLAGKIAKQDAQSLALEFGVKMEHGDGVYIGFSVIKDGISIAEITTSRVKPITTSGKVSYRLDTTILNAGTYQIGAGLYNVKNSQLVSMTKNKLQFIIKGSDETRGAALKLADTWEY